MAGCDLKTGVLQIIQSQMTDTGHCSIMCFLIVAGKEIYIDLSF